MKKNCKITLETARQFYKEGGAAKAFALDNFTEAELIAESRAMSWEELGSIEGEYINTDSTIVEDSGICCKNNRNVFPKGYAKAALALAQLLQLRDNWNDGWKYIPGTGQGGYCIINFGNELTTDFYKNANCSMSFKTRELRDEFLVQFRDLLTEALPLL